MDQAVWYFHYKCTSRDVRVVLGKTQSTNRRLIKRTGPQFVIGIPRALWATPKNAKLGLAVLPQNQVMDLPQIR